MDTRPTRSLLLPALLVAAGLATAGFLVGRGFAMMRTADRTVSVKGVSEREAKADLAIWPLRLMASNDDLGAASRTLEKSVQAVRAFLVANQLDGTAAEITVQEFVVQDQRSMGAMGERYVIRQTLVVRSPRVDLVQQATLAGSDLLDLGRLIAEGAVLDGVGGVGRYPQQPGAQKSRVEQLAGRPDEHFTLQ
jgi:hypothetical protein